MEVHYRMMHLFVELRDVVTVYVKCQQKVVFVAVSARHIY